MYDDVTVTEIIGPAAVLSGANAQRLRRRRTEADDVRTRKSLAPRARMLAPVRASVEGQGRASAAAARLLGSIEVAYGMPTRYEITIFRATITLLGARLGNHGQLAVRQALGKTPT